MHARWQRSTLVPPSFARDHTWVATADGSLLVAKQPTYFDSQSVASHAAVVCGLSLTLTLVVADAADR